MSDPTIIGDTAAFTTPAAPPRDLADIAADLGEAEVAIGCAADKLVYAFSIDSELTSAEREQVRDWLTEAVERIAEALAELEAQ